MKHLVIIAIAFFGLLATLEAGVDFTPHPGYDAPKYFSGTNARAFYSAMPTFPDDKFDEAKLLLNDEVVISRTYVDPPGVISAGGDSMAVMFDSGHFAHADDVEVKMKVRIGTTWYEHTYTAPVYNKAMVYGNGQINSGGSIFAQQCQDSCNDAVAHAKSVFDSLSFNTFSHHYPFTWNVQNFESSVHFGTGAHITTHGKSSWCHHCSGAYLVVPGGDGSHLGHTGHVQFSNIYLPKRAAFGGPPPMLPTLPPFNTGPNSVFGPGPFGIVLLDVCDVGADQSFCEAFLYPNVNAYVPFTEDQAVVGWDGQVSQINSLDRCRIFWDALAVGKTAEQARGLMAAEEATLSDPYPGQAVIYGDPYSRLSTVYTGDNSQAVNGWYR